MNKLNEQEATQNELKEIIKKNEEEKSKIIKDNLSVVSGPKGKKGANPLLKKPTIKQTGGQGAKQVEVPAKVGSNNTVKNVGSTKTV